jgi:hypothetical protein
MTFMDVVCVTASRKSLTEALQSALNVIPDANIILVTDKSRNDLTLGMLRNRGLAKVHSEFVCFLDDDIILNTDWYNKCMKRLEDKSVIAVAGKGSTSGIVGDTLGCMVCKTKQFKAVRGFPKLDSYLENKIGKQFVIVQDAICEHRPSRGLTLIWHTLLGMQRNFQTESKVGHYKNPKDSVNQIISSLKKGYPDNVVCELLWIIKTSFSLPFIVFIGQKDVNKK